MSQPSIHPSKIPANEVKSSPLVLHSRCTSLHRIVIRVVVISAVVEEVPATAVVVASVALVTRRGHWLGVVSEILPIGMVVPDAVIVAAAAALPAAPGLVISRDVAHGDGTPGQPGALSVVVQQLFGSWNGVAAACELFVAGVPLCLLLVLFCLFAYRVVSDWST